MLRPAPPHLTSGCAAASCTRSVAPTMILRRGAVLAAPVLARRTGCRAPNAVPPFWHPATLGAPAWWTAARSTPTSTPPGSGPGDDRRRGAARPTVCLPEVYDTVRRALMSSARRCHAVRRRHEARAPTGRLRVVGHRGRGITLPGGPRTSMPRTTRADDLDATRATMAVRRLSRGACMRRVVPYQGASVDWPSSASAGVGSAAWLPVPPCSTRRRIAASAAACRAATRETYPFPSRFGRRATDPGSSSASITALRAMPMEAASSMRSLARAAGRGTAFRPCQTGSEVCHGNVGAR